MALKRAFGFTYMVSFNAVKRKTKRKRKKKSPKRINNHQKPSSILYSCVRMWKAWIKKNTYIAEAMTCFLKCKMKKKKTSLNIWVNKQMNYCIYNLKRNYHWAINMLWYMLWSYNVYNHSESNRILTEQNKLSDFTRNGKQKKYTN